MSSVTFNTVTSNDHLGEEEIDDWEPQTVDENDHS